MKLSLKMISERLELRVRILKFKDMYSTIRLERPVLLAGETELRPNTLYIAAEALPETLQFNEGSALILAGSEDTDILRYPAVILVDSSEDMQNVFEEVTRIFDFFNQWEQQLERAAGMSDQMAAFALFLEASSELFENTLAISDLELRYLSLTKEPLPISSDVKTVPRSAENAYPVGSDRESVVYNNLAFQTLPPEMLASYRRNASLRRLISEREIFVATDPAIPYRVMIRNLYSGSVVLYHLSVAEDVRPFRETDYQLLEFLARQIEKQFRHAYDIRSDENAVLTQLLTRVLEDTKQRDLQSTVGAQTTPLDIASTAAQNIASATAQEIAVTAAQDIASTAAKKIASTTATDIASLEEELKKIHWLSENEYIFCVCHAQTLLPDASVLNEMLRNYPGTFALWQQGEIAVLVNLDQYRRAVGEEITGDTLRYFGTELTMFLQEHGMQAGVSNPFWGLKELPRYYHQACTALNTSHVLPQSTVQYFSDCILPYVFRKAKEEFTGEDLLSPIYLRLKRHDEQYNTEYLKTLREYLLQNLNAVQAASTLYIHRATIIYRLKRICEIGQTDLKKPDELLHLALSFKIEGLF